jgi:hypothetical protein
MPRPALPSAGLPTCSSQRRTTDAVLVAGQEGAGFPMVHMPDSWRQHAAQRGRRRGKPKAAAIPLFWPHFLPVCCVHGSMPGGRQVLPQQQLQRGALGTFKPLALSPLAAATLPAQHSTLSRVTAWYARARADDAASGSNPGCSRASCSRRCRVRSCGRRAQAWDGRQSAHVGSQHIYSSNTTTGPCRMLLTKHQRTTVSKSSTRQQRGRLALASGGRRRSNCIFARLASSPIFPAAGRQAGGRAGGRAGRQAGARGIRLL